MSHPDPNAAPDRTPIVGGEVWENPVTRERVTIARLGHTDSKGMPHPLQLSLIAREFGDVVVFRSPPSAVQLLLFGVPPGARWRGYHATYPQRSRILLAPRT